MALLKSTVTETGFTATYWKVEMVMVNSRTGLTTISASLFKDQAARDAGSTPVQTISLSAPNSTFDQQVSGSATAIEIAYEHLKTESMFSGAEDA